MDVSRVTPLKDPNAGEAELFRLCQKLIAPATIHRYVGSVAGSVWTIKSRGADFCVIFCAPISARDLEWKAQRVAKVVKFAQEPTVHGVFATSTPAGEFFDLEVIHAIPEKEGAEAP
jgi:hypothetical protein